MNPDDGDPTAAGYSPFMDFALQLQLPPLGNGATTECFSASRTDPP